MTLYSINLLQFIYKKIKRNNDSLVINNITFTK